LETKPPPATSRSGHRPLITGPRPRFLRRLAPYTHNRRPQLDRKLGGLRPFHRLAYDKYRSHGLFLPYGALDAEHNAPNKTLLTPGRGWMLGDGQDPLDAWQLEVRPARQRVNGRERLGTVLLLL
jgi:hypothetical protein